MLSTLLKPFAMPLRRAATPLLFKPSTLRTMPVAMFSTSLQDKFNNYVTQGGPKIASLSPDKMLEFYGLYKQATAGDATGGKCIPLGEWCFSMINVGYCLFFG